MTEPGVKEVILTYITNQVSYWMIGLAWGYVGSRVVHSLVQATVNINEITVFATVPAMLSFFIGTLMPFSRARLMPGGAARRPGRGDMDGL